MAHNTRVFDPPVVFAQTIGPAELNAIDVLVSESVNGDMGGVWAPVTPIIFGGAGLQVTGTTVLSGATSVVNVTRTGPLVLSGPLATTTLRVGSATLGVKLNTSKDIWTLPVPLLAVSYTVNDSTAPTPSEGMQMTVRRQGVGAFDITLKREDTTTIVTLPSATQCGVTMTYFTLDGWQVTGGFGGYVL